MKKVKNLLLSTLMILTLGTVSAEEKGLNIAIQLSPTGSFNIKTGKVNGHVVKSGNMYMAKDLEVKVANFETGIDLRDKHVKEKLEFKKYPKIKILQAKGKGGKGVAVMKVRNKKKKVAFTYSEVPGNKVEVKFDMNIKDLGFKGISYMGIGVKDNVTINGVVPLVANKSSGGKKRAAASRRKK